MRRGVLAGAVLTLGGMPLLASNRGVAHQLPELVLLDAVGCVMCDGPSAFGQIQGIGLLSDGSLVVLDRDEPMVRIIDPSGAATATWGRRGDGPGELRMPLAVAVTAGDGVVVADAMKTGLTVYGRDGALQGGRSVRQTAMELRGVPGGAWLAVQEARWRTLSAAVLLMGPSLEVAGVAVQDTRGVLTDAAGDPAMAGAFSSAPGPDGRVAVGEGSNYLVKVVDSAGHLLHEIRRDIPRVPRTRAELEVIREERERARRARGGSNPEARGPDVPVDPLHPHFHPRNALHYDAMGRLWVRTPRGGPEVTVFDLFDPEGGYMGEIGVPRAVDDFVLGPGLLAGVVKDPANGVQQVLRWAIREAR